MKERGAVARGALLVFLFRFEVAGCFCPKKKEKEEKKETRICSLEWCE